MRTHFPIGYKPDGQNFTIINILYGPCPKCGSDGKVPDGRYDAFGDLILASLRDIADVQIIAKAIGTIKTESEQGASPEKITKKVKAEIPQLQSVWNLIPRTREEAYAFVTLLLALLTLLISCFQTFKSSSPRSTIIN